MYNHSLSTHNDSTLVSLFINGNNEAMGVLIERHTQKLKEFLSPLLKDSYVTEEIIQDTFLKAMLAIKNGKYNEEGMFYNWLVRSARNKAMDYFRDKKTGLKSITVGQTDLFTNENYSDNAASHEPAPDELIIRMEKDVDVELLLSKLPAEQCEVIMLRIFHDFDFKEIAELTQVSINTALGRMRYALINLRRIIEENERKKVWFN